MTTVAWFHCFAGIAGDMALGSLLDAGADIDEIRSTLGTLPFTGWTLEAEEVHRGGLRATRAVVKVDDDGSERTAEQITAMIRSATLPPRATARALAIFERLAAAEGAVHGIPASAVHFHEVGGHDAIVDVVGTVIALELLGVDEVRASNVAVGHGTVPTRHGTVPNPGPAVVELLRGAPLVGRPLDIELTTPTGAAILAALTAGYGPLPGMTVDASGYGAGTREIDGLPNCTQVVIGRLGVITSPGEGAGQPLTLVETNLDDATGEQIADTLGALFAAGAVDAWVTPVLMKKGRPGHVVSALCDAALLGVIRDLLLTEGGSFGVRVTPVDRYATVRRLESVDVDGHRIQMKVNDFRVKVEHDDAARAAAALGITVREVSARATAAYEARRSMTGPTPPSRESPGRNG
jgi:hypothetical protein